VHRVLARPREHDRHLARAHLGDQQQRHDQGRRRAQRGADAADEAGGDPAQPLADHAAGTMQREAAVRERKVQQDRDRAEQQQRATRLAHAVDHRPPPEGADRRDQHPRDDQVRGQTRGRVERAGDRFAARAHHAVVADVP
jgi:hypothetical protein